MDYHTNSDNVDDSISQLRQRPSYTQRLTRFIGGLVAAGALTFGLGGTPTYGQEADKPKDLWKQNEDTAKGYHAQIKGLEKAVDKASEELQVTSGKVPTRTYTLASLVELRNKLLAINVAETTKRLFPNDYEKDDKAQRDALKALQNLEEKYVLIGLKALKLTSEDTTPNNANYVLAHQLIKEVQEYKKFAAQTLKTPGLDDLAAADLASLVKTRFHTGKTPGQLFYLANEFDKVEEKVTDAEEAGKKATKATYESLLEVKGHFETLKGTKEVFSALPSDDQKYVIGKIAYCNSKLPGGKVPGDAPEGKKPEEPKDPKEPKDPTPPRTGDGKKDETPEGPRDLSKLPYARWTVPELVEAIDKHPKLQYVHFDKESSRSIPTWLNGVPSLNGERRNLNGIFADASGSSYSGPTHGQSGRLNLGVRNGIQGFPLDLGLGLNYEDRGGLRNSRRLFTIDGGVAALRLGPKGPLAMYVSPFYSKLTQRRTTPSGSSVTDAQGLLNVTSSLDRLVQVDKAVASQQGLFFKINDKWVFYANNALFEASKKSRNTTNSSTSVTGTITPDPVVVDVPGVGPITVQPPNQDINVQTQTNVVVVDRHKASGTLGELGVEIKKSKDTKIRMGLYGNVINRRQHTYSIIDGNRTEILDTEHNEWKYGLSTHLSSQLSKPIRLHATGLAGLVNIPKNHGEFAHADAFASINLEDNYFLIGGAIDWRGNIGDNLYKMSLGFFRTDDKEDAKERTDGLLRVLARGNNDMLSPWYTPSQRRRRELDGLKDIGSLGIAYVGFGPIQFGGAKSSRWGVSGGGVIPLNAFFLDGKVNDTFRNIMLYAHGTLISEDKRRGFTLGKTYSGNIGLAAEFNVNNHWGFRVYVEGGIEKGAFSSTLDDRTHHVISGGLELLLGFDQSEKQKKRRALLNELKTRPDAEVEKAEEEFRKKSSKSDKSDDKKVEE